MLFVYIFAPYTIISLIIFVVITKKWSKKNHWALNVFYALTLLSLYPIELYITHLIRNKYVKKTPIVIKMLQSENIKFHIVFGTFLFAYRNNNFADNDIDIAMFRGDFTNKTRDSLKKLGFVLKEQWSLDSKVSEQTYIHPKLKVSMDIFHMSKGLEFAPTFDEKNKRYARRPKSYKYEISIMNINGLKVEAPSNPEEYLEWNYGAWKIPDKNYHWFHGSSSSPTIIIDNANIDYKKFD